MLDWLRVDGHITACFFFFNDTATTEIYTLSLHDALPISSQGGGLYHQDGAATLTNCTFSGNMGGNSAGGILNISGFGLGVDRKSTRLNSSHSQISYAVFCLKKKITATEAMHVRQLSQPSH